jgi:sigma-54 dependent transcriptional regulator
VIHHALVVCQDGIVRMRDLRLVNLPAVTPSAPPTPPAPPASGASPMDRAAVLFAELLRNPPPGLHGRLEAALLRAAYAHHGRNQVVTARALGLSRHSLRTLLRRHGLLGDPESGEQAQAMRVEMGYADMVR